MNRRRLLIAALAAPLLNRQPRTPEANSRVLEAVWNGVRGHFYDPRTRGVNWAEVKEEYLPKALACASEGQLLDLLREMLSHLPNSHIFLYSREEWSWRSNILPFYMERAGGRAYVRYVLRKDARPLAALEPGDEVLAVDAVPSGEIRPLTLARLDPIRGNPNFGPAGSVSKVEVLRGSRRITLDVCRVPRPGGFDSAVLDRPRPAIFHLRFFTLDSNELPADKLGPLWEEATRGRALVLDLRNCVGGDGKVSGFIASSLLGPGRSLFKSVPRPGSGEDTTTAKTGSNTTPFAGHVAVIANSNTESEPELLMAICKEYGRGRIFGERTAGAFIGPTLAIDLPDHFARFAVPYAASISPRGVDYEQKGVEPDEPVQNTVEELAKGFDAPLARALRFVEA
jgi:C-terminal processing protease CtpA/Prc